MESDRYLLNGDPKNHGARAMNQTCCSYFVHASLSMLSLFLFGANAFCLLFQLWCFLSRLISLKTGHMQYAVMLHLVCQGLSGTVAGF